MEEYGCVALVRGGRDAVTAGQSADVGVRRAAVDDGKLENGMPLDDLGKRLDVLLSDVAALTSYLQSLQTNLTSLRAEVQSGFKRVEEELSAARSRDQELHRLLKFSVQAGEGFRESVEARFDDADVKQDEQIDLLKQVVRQSASPRTGT